MWENRGEGCIRPIKMVGRKEKEGVALVAWGIDKIRKHISADCQKVLSSF